MTDRAVRTTPGLPAPLSTTLAEGGRELTLFVIRLGAMGDILRTLPPVRLLRRQLPHAKILWMLDENWAGLLTGHPDLDSLVPVNRAAFDQPARSPFRWPQLIGAVADFRRELRARAAGLAIDFHGNLRSGILTRLTGAPVRLGYAGHQQKECNRRFTTHLVPSGDRRTPRMERNLDLVRALGLSDAPLPPAGLPLAEKGSESARAVVSRLFPEAQEFAIVAPGASASQAYKKPPAGVLTAACEALARHGVNALVVYGPDEESDARAVVDRANGQAVLAPPTDLATLAALSARARLFVGGDSGPLHMACATGCPVLGVYGPTDPEVNRPWYVPYRRIWPVGRRYTGIKKLDRAAGGFEGLSDDQARAAVDELMAETRTYSRSAEG